VVGLEEKNITDWEVVYQPSFSPRFNLTVDYPQYITCPFCNSILSSENNYVFCPYCGSRLKEAKSDDISKKLNRIISMLEDIICRMDELE